MSAVDTELGYAGLKSYAWLPGGTPFVVCLFDLERAELAAVIEADALGQRRTGAASGVAAKYLARAGATDARRDRLRLAGREPGRAASVPRCRRSSGSSRTAARRSALAAFCEKVGAEPAESHREAADADVVVTVTTSDDPVLRGEWLRPGALVCAVGANDPRKRELDNVVARARGLRLLRLDRRREAGVRRPDRARRAGGPRLARGARAPGGRRGRGRRPPAPTTTSCSSSRTGSPPGTSRSGASRSSGRASAESGRRSSPRATRASRGPTRSCRRRSRGSPRAGRAAARAAAASCGSAGSGR